MRRLFLSVGLVAVLPLGTAQAQQNPPPVQIPASAYGTWTGFYVGVAFGGGALIDNLRSTEAAVSVNANAIGGQGMLASIYGGVDYQVAPRAVIGLVIEGTYSGLETPVSAQLNGTGTFATARADLSWAGLLRAGFLPSPKTLVYAIGGYSGQRVHSEGMAGANGVFTGFGRDDIFNGWSVGAGFEAMLSRAWATKLEYRYSQYAEMQLPFTQVSLQPSTHTVRLGLSYKFGSPAGPESADPPPAEATPDWSGIYFGLSGGGVASVNAFSAYFPNNARTATTSGAQDFMGGVYGGFDLHAAPRIIIGLMGEVAWTGPQSVTAVNAAGSNASAMFRPGMNVSGMARAGYLVTPSTLLYAAGGYTGESASTTAMAYTPSGTAFAQRDDYFNGWTLGPGIETVLFDGWTTRLEYRYSQFEEKNINGVVDVLPKMHSARIGFAYKFGREKQPASTNN